MKNDFQFSPLLISLSGLENEQPSSGDGWTSELQQQRTASAGQLELGPVAPVWVHLIQIVSRVCIIFSVLRSTSPSLPVRIWLGGRVVNPGQLTQTRTGLLFSSCAVKRDALVEVGEASRENTLDPSHPQNLSVDLLLITLSFIILSSAGVIHTAHQPTTPLHTSRHASLHPQSFNPEGSKTPFAVGGGGVGAGRGPDRWE